MTVLLAAGLLAVAAAILVGPAPRRPPGRAVRSAERRTGPAAASGAAAALRVRGWGRRRARDRAAGQRRAEVAAAASALAAQMRAGRPPPEALSVAAEECPSLELPAAVAGLGADVPAALRHAAREPGADALALLAAAWSLSETTGAPLAAILARTAEAVRAHEALTRQVSAELAPVRTTARLLAALPLATLALGAALGGAPLTVLLGTPWGAACGAAGVLLACAGVAWVSRLARGAVRSPWALP